MSDCSKCFGEVRKQAKRIKNDIVVVVGPGWHSGLNVWLSVGSGRDLKVVGSDPCQALHSLQGLRQTLPLPLPLLLK